MPSHTTIAAYLALALAAGGGATAGASALSRDSVGTAQIRDRSVHVRDLARTARPPSRARIAAVVTDTMTSADVLSALSAAVKGGPGPQGSQGAQGPQGAPGVATVVVRTAESGTVGPNESAAVPVRCQQDEKALGGGGRFQADSGQAGAVLTASQPTDDAQGWTVAMTNGGASPSGRVVARVVCAQVGS
jgi:hypothetical protein